MDNARIWILAEQDGERVQRVSHELLSRGLDLASKRGCKLGAMLFGWNINRDDLQELIDRGADQIAIIEAEALAYFRIEPYALCMREVIRKFDPEIIIAGATSMGRTLMPYVAIKARTGLTADCTGLDIEPETQLLLQTRPAIGGNIMATIKTPNNKPQMATVRPRSTKPAPKQIGREGRIVSLDMPGESLISKIRRLRFVRNDEEQGLADADIVVAVGRGIKKGENIPMVRQLAEAMGAALGATRDVVDRGWLSYPHQIGLSGQTVSPKLYIGVGVSGAIQHLAGMQTAETIVTINSDPNAQLFKVADFGIVGNLFEVIPALTQTIRQELQS